MGFDGGRQPEHVSTKFATRRTTRRIFLQGGTSPSAKSYHSSTWGIQEPIRRRWIRIQFSSSYQKCTLVTDKWGEEETISRRPKRNHSDSKDDSLSAYNDNNTSLLKFKMTLFEWYNERIDPDDHIQNYKTAMRLMMRWSLLCVSLSLPHWERLPRIGWTTYAKSITSFRDLAYFVYNQFAVNKKMKKNSAILLVL